MSRAVWVVVSAVCVGVLAGCSGSPDEPAGLSATPTTAVEPSPTPTPTPTPSSEVQDQSDPALGIVFTDIPDLTGDEADVYNTLATYQKEYWRTLTTNTVSPAFSVIAAAEIQDRMQQIATTNANDLGQIGPVFHTSIGNVVVTGDTAQGAVCEDFSGATFADKDGTYTPDEAGFEKRLKSVTLSRVGGENRWIVLTSVVGDPC
ncbi:hypothetical protein [Cellulomonas sp. URHE0023]|uniref:hypothetical protein n=1 Tax=Cellulomonas sp. URHE0023 TaxID=1380354 RepID=UPI0012DD1AEE|nr:hypothetical protein [Cellulomonas sp. URHE0023]